MLSLGNSFRAKSLLPLLMRSASSSTYLIWLVSNFHMTRNASSLALLILFLIMPKVVERTFFRSWGLISAFLSSSCVFLLMEVIEPETMLVTFLSMTCEMFLAALSSLRWSSCIWFLACWMNYSCSSSSILILSSMTLANYLSRNSLASIF